ncbi:hypothetical protein QBC36DRAFT_388845 [Triangularia setosa]|uniref:Uncharacterized protein n=1 Tax=Triangularia setosa TaxID=2587417 RepID=A0AAN6W5J4_9PEZI|nr:hypothetical protein QBC36DRAFT_388845 [Podospora setosa]
MPEQVINSTNAKKDAINKLTDNGVNTLVATGLISAKMDDQARDAKKRGVEDYRYAGVKVDIVDKTGKKVGKGEIRVDYDPTKGPHINVVKGSDRFAFIASSIPGTDREQQIIQQKVALTRDVANNSDKMVVNLKAATAKFLHMDFWDVAKVSKTGQLL